ncbi:spore germination protein [Jeotgalibacillus marinus]|uniref:Spore germination protein n=1 Tax=Jeotgalibacillus marinus TaxID=86667 RepID=A0ABV3Q2R5_9BACL
MPAIVGPVQIINVGAGTVQFGDIGINSPKSSEQSSSGSGSFNTGPFILNNNIFSVNPTISTSGINQPIAGTL